MSENEIEMPLAVNVYMDGRTTDCKVLPRKYDKVWVK